MNERLMKWYVAKKSEQAIAKMPHQCNDCNQVDLAVRQVSTLYLLGYVLSGVLVGYWIAWILGFLVTLICFFINVNIAKKRCKHCGSTNVHLHHVGN
ncbi:ABC-type multidrug transport system permease subunit [Paenibacillus sp. 1182]|uniref:hypothetical protein n=1 Tax=Paenibacillus sp. 1182 TaxID=2806565 RepID=UPI001AE3DA8A|nr:hypothetical protein [Paenibacillus sp. 1182]MBP1308703.1 ABC-type multidrug transport system permease subunit [Paenibacillus sp. 1182]